MDGHLIPRFRAWFRAAPRIALRRYIIETQPNRFLFRATLGRQMKKF